MSNKIDSQVAPTTAPAPIRPVTRSRSDASPVATEAAKSGDSVVFTGAARDLQQLERRAKDDSGIDEAKVAEMRRILAQGLYSADPQAIAGRLMSLEHSLAQLK